MSKDGYWGDEVCLHAAANAFKININTLVWHEPQPMFLMKFSGNYHDKRTVHIGNMDNQHFVAIESQKGKR